MNKLFTLLLHVPFFGTGIQVYDSCGHKELSKIHLMDLYSVLENGFKDCNANESDIQTPGVIDVTGIAFDAKVAKVTRSNFIPILPLSMESALPPEVVAKIIGQLINDLTWTKVAIVYANDEHSTHVVKLLGQATLQTTTCFVLSQSMPDVKEELNDWPNSASDAKHKELFDSLITSLTQDTPVLVIGYDLSTKHFMNLLHQFPEKTSKLQWLFSSLPEPSFFRAFDSHLNIQKIYSLAPFPGKFSKFEEHWKLLQMPEPGPILGSWFDEYVCQEKGCEKSHAMDRLLHESELDVLWRTYLIIPIVHSIFTFSHAIRNSWIEECAGMRGLCPSLKAMNREEFVNRFLEPLLEQVTGTPEYNESSTSYDLNSSIPRRGGRRNEPGSKSSELGKLNWKLALTSFHLDESDGLTYRQYILYDSVSTEAHLLNKELPFTQSPCPSSGCKNCVKIRQAKQEGDALFGQSFPGENSPAAAAASPPPKECLNQCGQCWSRFVQSNQFNSSTFARENEVSSQTSLQPSMSSNFKQTWGIITAVSSSIGLICVLICATYFLMVFPLSIGTTVLGYMILFGLMAIYSVNFLFVLPPSSTVCWLRKVGMSIGYCTILSGMLVKTMNAWRRKVNKSKRVDDLKMTSPVNLLLVSCGLVAVHLIVTLAWLNLFPPKPGYYESSWRCYPPSSSSGGNFIVDTESVVSLLYIIFLILITVFFCLLTWKSSDVNREPRYILFSCLAVASVWIIWTLVAFKMRKRVAESRDVTIISANLASASLVMILLYLRKLYWYAKIKKKDRLVRARLHSSNFPANFYGAIHARHSIDSGSYPWDAMSYVSGGQSTTTSSIRGSISSIKGGPSLRVTSGKNKRPFQQSHDLQEDMDDGTASCASAASSVQVQGTDLYPMEVYDGGSQFQPSSLFTTTGNAIYANED